MKRKYGMHYSTFLKIMRTGKNVTLEHLGWGLCSISMMNRIEEGRRMPDKMMRDRLMDRLGVANDGFEDYLQPNEYARWKTRQDLLYAIENRDMDMAQRIICQYEESGDGGNAIECQFYLAMKTQLMRYRGASEEELCAVLGCALECTVPDCSMDKWKGRLLAAQEWNLLLEYISCGGYVGQVSGGGLEDPYKVIAYEVLLEAIQESKMDSYSSAKIYPKAAYFLCRELMERPKADWDCDRLLRVSDSAVEMLRSAERMYYLCELLAIEEQLLTLLAEQFRIFTGSIEGLLSKLEQVREWRKVLVEVYHDGGISGTMENDCYLYWQTQNYSYGDVVRKRRKMLGLSVEELCRGICEKRTIWRLESNKSNIHIEIIGELFERLGLSCEYSRQRIVTNQYEAIKLYDMATKALINRDTDALSRILPKMRKILPMDLVINQQEMEFLEILYQHHIGEITKEECVCKLKYILEYTIPLKYIKRGEECYLSCGETTYLCNIAMKTEGEEKKIYMNLLITICKQFVEKSGIKSYINTLEMYMCNIASYMGDEGEYARSNKISDEVMRECLSLRRMGMLKSCIYNRWWNQMECVTKHASVEQNYYTEHELRKCIQLARLCKDVTFEKFYCDKLKDAVLKITRT